MALKETAVWIVVTAITKAKQVSESQDELRSLSSRAEKPERSILSKATIDSGEGRSRASDVVE